MTDWSN
jgi:precorrin-8X/cobalt-precorrin-8 methylmutase